MPGPFRPVAFLLYQLIAHRIGKRVETKTLEGIAPSFLFAQGVIARLMLPLANVAQAASRCVGRNFMALS